MYYYYHYYPPMTNNNDNNYNIMSAPIKSKYNIVGNIHDSETRNNMKANPQKYAEGTYQRWHNAQYDNNSMIEYFHIRNNNGTKVFNNGKHPKFGQDPDMIPRLTQSQGSQGSQWGGKRKKIQTQNKRTTQRKSRKQKKRSKSRHAN